MWQQAMFDTLQMKKWCLIIVLSFAKKGYQNIGQSGYEWGWYQYWRQY